MVKIKEFKDGSFLGYDRGSFDEWCVYYTDINGMKRAPKDIEYFKKLYDFSMKYGVDKIYSDYVKIYDHTGKKIEKEILLYISKIANEYDEQDVLQIDIFYIILSNDIRRK